MENCSLFVHLDGECTYYDFFINIEQCLRDAGFNLKKDKERLEHVAVMLTLASAMVGGRPIPEYNKYIEMIKFVRNFKNAEGINNLIEMFDGSYVSSGVMLLHNECITPGEFEIYENVVDVFYHRCMSKISSVKFRSINASYTVAKNEVKKYFEMKEKAKGDGSKANTGDEEECDKQHALDSPYKLSRYLKKFVIGQDSAVDIFANTAFQYHRYIKSDKKLPKPYNVLIIGSSGSGKTTLMNAFDTISHVYMVDCTGVTESGYKGTDAKDIVKNSKYGNVVFYDEFDKLLVPSIDGSGRDTHKEVQGCFYKLMEESQCLNIFAGAFEGIDDIVRKRLKSKKTVVGFSTEAIDYDDVDIYDVTEEDLLAFGATREFTGRIDVIIRMRNLEEEDFVRILKNSEYSPVKSEIAVARDCYGIELELTDVFYSELAAKASSQAVGARSLKQHINRIIDPILAQGMDRDCSKVIVGSLDGEPQFIIKRNEK